MARVSRTMLSRALHHVAALYDADALTCGAEPGHERLAAQFQKQAQEARDLADAIENGDSVHFED